MIRKVEEPPGQPHCHGVGRVKAEEPDPGISIRVMDVRANVCFMEVRQARDSRQAHRTYPGHGESDETDVSPALEQVQLEFTGNEWPDRFRRKGPVKEHQLLPALPHHRMACRSPGRSQAVDRVRRGLTVRGGRLWHLDHSGHRLRGMGGSGPMRGQVRVPVSESRELVLGHDSGPPGMLSPEAFAMSSLASSSKRFRASGDRDQGENLMMPTTRQQIEVLLDRPDQHDYVLSAYVDMTVKDGFARDVDLHLKNQARAAAEALGTTQARKDLEANLEVVRQIVAEHTGSAAAGLAIFSSLPRGLRHVVPLDFEVENHLVIDEEPFLLPLLEQWYGEATHLIVLLDSDEAHLFLAHGGAPEWVRDLERKDAQEDYQRDKPRFTYKKRFARAQHERLHASEDDQFLHEVSAVVAEAWGRDHFAGLILLGQPPITASLRRLLPRELAQAVVAEAHHAMTARPQELSDDVGRIVEKGRTDDQERLLTELRERWRRDHLVASGPSEVLEALLQGRATRVIFGTHRDMQGARCSGCGYRFGKPLEVCPYCQATCKKVNAVQEILRMAVRHRIPVHLVRRGTITDPLAPVGVAAFLRAEANSAPPSGTAGPRS